jgi:hypothetical protein
MRRCDRKHKVRGFCADAKVARCQASNGRLGFAFLFGLTQRNKRLAAQALPVNFRVMRDRQTREQVIHRPSGGAPNANVLTNKEPRIAPGFLMGLGG